MKSCYLFAILALFLCKPSAAQVTASFTTTGSTCINTPVGIHNTSTGASNYYWSFCAADFNSTPEAVNLGNPNGALSEPVFGCYVQDADGNFYGLVNSHLDGHLIRLRFGNSLLNNPTAEDLGDFGGIIANQSEGIQLLKVKGNWTAILVGGGNDGSNSSPRVVKVDFGNALTNTPTATNWGNIGGLNLPLELFIGEEGGNYYGFTGNVNDNTITRLSFGPDFTNPPTGINMGNIGNLNYPDGLTFIKYNANWYCYVVNAGSNEIVRLDFGSSLQNTPVGVDIGDPGSAMEGPRDIALFKTCSGVYGFVVNANTNNLVKLNFGSDPTSVPSAMDLGNIGGLDFPHSLSDFFQVGNDIYSFIPNVNSNTLTRIRFAGCSDIPGSTQANPPPVTYTRPGVYNINLLVDLGLPTQTSYCQEVAIYGQPQGKLTGDTVCFGNSPILTYTADSGIAPFTIGYTDGTNSYTQAGLGNQSTVALPYPLTAPGTTTFTLTNIKDANGCSATTNMVAAPAIEPLPQGGISGTTACGSDSATLIFSANSGTAPFTLQFSNGSATITEAVYSGTAFNAKLVSTPTTYSLLTVSDVNGCSRSAGFDNATAAVVPLPAPVLRFDPMAAVCINSGPEKIDAASETSGLAGTGSYSGPGIEPGGGFRPDWAGAGVYTIVYTYTARNGCVAADSSRIVVNPAPVQAAELLVGCDGISVQLSVPKNGASYDWTPAAGLSDPHIANPEATPDASTQFVAVVLDSDGCAASDTVMVKELGSVKTAFMVPNAFTPNGDGHNDCFGIRQWGDVTLEQLDVFDRWGARVFSTTNPSDCWDGSLNGMKEPAGAYVFVIRADTPCGKITRTGTLMLIR